MEYSQKRKAEQIPSKPSSSQSMSIPADLKPNKKNSLNEAMSKNIYTKQSLDVLKSQISDITRFPPLNKSNHRTDL